MRRDDFIRIAWPFDAMTENAPGVVVGFKNSNLDFFVVTILHRQDPHRVAKALGSNLLWNKAQYHIPDLLALCGNLDVEVLGTIDEDSPSARDDEYPLTLRTSPELRFPILTYTGVSLPSRSSPTVQWIGFDRPSSSQMQFFSLFPIALPVDDKSNAYKWVDPLDRVDVAEKEEKKRTELLLEKLKKHTVIHNEPTPKDKALTHIIEQANCSAELAQLLHRAEEFIGARSKRSLSVSERVVKSASNASSQLLDQLWQTWVVYVHPVGVQTLTMILIAFRILTEFTLRILEWRFLPNAPAIKDVSATAQQVDIRLQQFCYWPIQYMTLRDRKQNWQSITSSHTEYIRFYNSIWLVANDVIIGMAIGSYIMENSKFVSDQLDLFVTDWSINGLRRMIVWLMGWPAGLKSNTELATFLGDLFLWVIDYWASYISTLRPFLPTVIYFVGCASLAGATMPISILSDLISVLTIHIDCFYAASAKIYNWQLTILFSLFHLFRGRKHNVLRNRIDKCEYELDQLLLGTILFTILSFLLPTVLIFYVTFACARAVMIIFKACLETGLACLNHFPLFALMLKLKNSRRLPGGIRFEVVSPKRQSWFSFGKNRSTPTPSFPSSPSSSSSSPSQPFRATHIQLESVPLPLHMTFHSYLHLFSRLRAHYMSVPVAFCLLTGRFVPPLHRKNMYNLQYSMLPAERVKVWDLWMRLKGEVRNARRASNAEAINSSSKRRLYKYDRDGAEGVESEGWWDKIRLVLRLQ